MLTEVEVEFIFDLMNIPLVNEKNYQTLKNLKRRHPWMFSHIRARDEDGGKVKVEAYLTPDGRQVAYEWMLIE